MNASTFACSHALGNPGLTAMAVATMAAFFTSYSLADLAVHRVQVAAPAESRVPHVTAQDGVLAPQAISAVDVSADGKFITVGTMAFSHDANVWQFAPDGSVLARRHFPPWAPRWLAGNRWRWEWLIPASLRQSRRCGSVKPGNCQPDTERRNGGSGLARWTTRPAATWRGRLAHGIVVVDVPPR